MRAFGPRACPDFFTAEITEVFAEYTESFFVTFVYSLSTLRLNYSNMNTFFRTIVLLLCYVSPSTPYVAQDRLSELVTIVLRLLNLFRIHLIYSILC